MTHSTLEELQMQTAGFGVLREIERHVLWLSTAIIHEANLVRPNTSGLKVGGHQTSSASMVSIMTSLWFRHLRPQDRVSVKPHALPRPARDQLPPGRARRGVPASAARVRRAAELSKPIQGS